ncbi:disease resistance protein RUN1-like [Rhodamnia argentea]|uniref:Disease resistance protein RUN1-like n=1 Tax=Rhodamnia argentea TaxID=178133 RepID=A0A8B8MUD1_9MYRT|nr:disease resistance protein RUN1-like [Rhodamnia argentea]
MAALVFGRSVAALVAPVIVSVIAYKHLNKKKASNYDVFLSFCDDDAPKSFADRLYNGLAAAGICVFRDDDWPRPREKIGPDLVQAIKNSKISLPILSPKYASSRRCLDELVQIMECRNDSSGHIVLPVFYGAERRELHGFGQKLPDERKRQAVMEFSSLKGWESQKVANGNEEQLVKLVVRKVLIELKKALEPVISENSVGIKSPMKDIMEFVDNSHGSTLFIGIHGRGGVGKTTLARVIYNKLSSQFDHCSFIADVGESCKCNGVENLQSQLISDILKEENRVYDKDEGISFISSRFKDKKVLVLLDDVNANHQLQALAGERNWFALGSRIIITTRNKSILDCAKVDYEYKHKEMDEDEAKILFSRHAFRRDSPPSEFLALSDLVVSIIRRFPLTLEVLGSYFCGKSQASWIHTIRSLENLRETGIKQILRIIYEALECEQKKTFLDIACFLVGSDSRIASCMWDAGDFNLVVEIEELIFMSLIKIGDNHELRMHDELRDLGRGIVREGYCNEPDNGRRLWDYEEALKVLEGSKGIENIRALSLDKGNSKETVDIDSSERITDQGSQIYTNEQFKNLPSLQFLHVSAATFMGDFNETFSKLRWLRWERCPQTLKAKNFGVKELAVLDLSRSMIADSWQGWSSIRSAKMLKVLNLTGCRSLKSTFFLSDFKNLEILILRNCDKLGKIDSSIGDLENLVSLDLSGCLLLDELPVGVGNSKGLKELLLDQTQIREIPSFIGSLRKLEMLSAKECKSLARLPDSICHLVNLSTIVLSDCLAPLPDGIWSLVKLRRLSLQNCCQLRLIHVSIGKLESLTELVLTDTSIMELPESIENLQNLEILNISGAAIRKLPSAIGKLRKLRELDASWCITLSEVTSSIYDLSSLQRFDLLGCLELQSLPKLPSNLTVVGVTCKSAELPSFSHLIRLKQLRLHNCKSLICIPELPSTLLELEVSGCEALQFLTPLKAVKDFKVSLKRLDIIRCKSVGKLDLSQLNHLRVLYALDCKNILEIGGLDRLSCLESLTIQGADSTELDKPFSAVRKRAYCLTH